MSGRHYVISFVISVPLKEATWHQQWGLYLSDLRLRYTLSVSVQSYGGHRTTEFLEMELSLRRASVFANSF